MAYFRKCKIEYQSNLVQFDKDNIQIMSTANISHPVQISTKRRKKSNIIF